MVSAQAWQLGGYALVLRPLKHSVYLTSAPVDSSYDTYYLVLVL